MLGNHRSWPQSLRQWNRDKGVSESGGREPKHSLPSFLPAHHFSLLNYCRMDPLLCCVWCGEGAQELVFSFHVVFEAGSLSLFLFLCFLLQDIWSVNFQPIISTITSMHRSAGVANVPPLSCRQLLNSGVGIKLKQSGLYSVCLSPTEPSHQLCILCLFLLIANHSQHILMPKPSNSLGENCHLLNLLHLSLGRNLHC